ncbi:MAG: ATP-binding protein [Bacteroidetes bacterium]|nr:MAG: ATP-binding protein [Bacteroidota bacterium]
MIYRAITPLILSALSDTPVVLLNGARQSGKSTLAQWIVEQKHKAHYLTLDDPSVLEGAKHDPVGFLEGFDTPLVIDEVQRVPELFLAIKAQVDKRRAPGKFLLTGSANVLSLPRSAEYLVGRMEILTLWPLSQSELEESRGRFIDSVFTADFRRLHAAVEPREGLLGRVLRGGYPEIHKRSTRKRREAWFHSYLTTILQREVHELSNIEGLSLLPRLLTLLASRSGSLINIADISSGSKLPQTTLRRYISLLEAAFLIVTLPAWSANIGKRLIKTPKMYLTDTGIMAHLLEMNADYYFRDSAKFGQIMENFVVMEILKQLTWSNIRPSAYYFRTASGVEVDLILERRDGSVVGIEIKSSASVRGDDFNSLRALAYALGEKFIRGIVLYTGKETIPFGNNLFALPVGCLWAK